MTVIGALRPLLPLELRQKVYEYLQYPGAYKRHWKKKYTKMLTCPACRETDGCVMDNALRKIRRANRSRGG